MLRTLLLRVGGGTVPVKPSNRHKCEMVLTCCKTKVLNDKSER